jgi:putative transposase
MLESELHEEALILVATGKRQRGWYGIRENLQITKYTPKILTSEPSMATAWNMSRARKTHVQQQLRWANAAGDLRGRKRERRAAGKKKLGRPKKPGAGQPHVKREAFKASEPLHITLRAVRGLGKLRTKAGYAAIREATIAVLKLEEFRIVHLSIQGTHVHLLVEAKDKAALAKGMQTFGISAAKQINAAVSKAGNWWERAQARARGERPMKRRKGRVFDRYHATIIRSPRQARHELNYVLNNWRKHEEDLRDHARGWLIDPFASGWMFDGWKERADEPFVWKLRASYEPMPVWRAKTWLLSEGWRRYGLISTHERPGKRIIAA